MCVKKKLLTHRSELITRKNRGGTASSTLNPRKCIRINFNYGNARFIECRERARARMKYSAALRLPLLCVSAAKHRRKQQKRKKRERAKNEGKESLSQRVLAISRALMDPRLAPFSRLMLLPRVFGISASLLFLLSFFFTLG